LVAPSGGVCSLRGKLLTSSSIWLSLPVCELAPELKQNLSWLSLASRPKQQVTAEHFVHLPELSLSRRQ
jgi:hypothetical protein